MSVIFVIAIALVTGGMFAYLGSIFGRQIGRRKISFWGLRPRYTSLLITIVIGMFTSFFTIVLIASFSQKTKTALMGLTQLQGEKRRLEEEIQHLSEIERRSSSLFQLNEPVAAGIVQAGSSYQDVERQVRKILQDASREIETRYDTQAIVLKKGLPDKKVVAGLLEYESGEFENLLAALTNEAESQAVLVYSQKNVYFGDHVKVRFNVYPDARIFRKGEKLMAARIKGNGLEERNFFTLMGFLKELEQSVEKKGIMRVPRSKALIDIPMSEVFALLSEIKGHNGWIELTAYAEDDAYTTGPVNIKLTINRL